MSFRDEVKDTTRAVMIETFITSLFSDPNRRFGDILEDLIETDDPDDDWMRETLYDLEIGQIVRAGVKVMGLVDGDLPDQSDIEGATNDESEVEPAPPPRKKKKKKKKPSNGPEAAPKKKKKKKKKKPEVSSTRGQDNGDGEDEAGNWSEYKMLIVKALRASNARDEETAVNNGVILNAIHGEDNWDKAESAQLRAAMEELGEAGKTDKVGQRRGTRYHLN